MENIIPMKKSSSGTLNNQPIDSLVAINISPKLESSIWSSELAQIVTLLPDLYSFMERTWLSQG
jgi:hypothetical protein